MAIIRKSALGITTGKIGNIVLRDLNGQNVVQQYNNHVNVIGSTKQNEQRNRIKNIMFLYHQVANFIQDWGKDRKTTQSPYNYFVSKYSKIMPNIFDNNLLDLLQKCVDVPIQSGNYLNVIMTSFNQNLPFYVWFEYKNQPYNPDAFAKVLFYDIDKKTIQVYKSFQDSGYWEFGILAIKNPPVGRFYVISYIFVANAWLSSNLYFSKLQNLV